MRVHRAETTCQIKITSRHHILADERFNSNRIVILPQKWASDGGSKSLLDSCMESCLINICIGTFFFSSRLYPPFFSKHGFVNVVEHKAQQRISRNSWDLLLEPYWQLLLLLEMQFQSAQIFEKHNCVGVVAGRAMHGFNLVFKFDSKVINSGRGGIL